jgi:hypothetical protein
MSNYNRTTRECSVSQLHPELRQTIRGHFQEQNLGDPETECLVCCETVSEKKDSSRLVSWLKSGMDSTIHVGMLLMPEQLIWVRRGDRSATVLNAANLIDIQVREYKSIFTKETGLEIFGFISTSKGQVHGYVGMGEEESAQKFCEAVQNAVNALQPPPAEKTGLARWLYPRK